MFRRALSPTRVSLLSLALLLALPLGLALFGGGQSLTAEENEDFVETAKKLREFSRQGQQAFEAKEFGKSVEAFQNFLKLLPKEAAYNETRSHAHYYAACALAQMKNADESLKNLEAALDNGFGNLDYIQADPDLSILHSQEKFKALITKHEKLAAEKLQKFDFSVQSIDDKPLVKKNYLGKVLVVDVWGTWCPPCRKGIPHFIKLQKTYQSKGLQVVGLNQERAGSQEAAVARVKSAVESFGINYPCGLVTDQILATIPEFRAFPTTMIVGRDGRTRKMMVGYHDYEDLEKVVKRLLEEKPPAPATEKKAAAGVKSATNKQ